MQKNALFLVIDSIRHDVLSDARARRFLMPKLSRLADKGFVLKVVTNAQSTQFVLPSLFSVTYPLDFGGYNTGIRERPRSFVELLRDEGYTTHKYVTSNQVGVNQGYERGFDTVRTASDFRVILEHHLDRVMNYELSLWNAGERTEEETVQIVQREFGFLLERIREFWTNLDKTLWPARLMRINRRVMRGLDRERVLVSENPRFVMEKVSRISGAMYWRFLGDEQVSPIKRTFWHAVGFMRQKLRRWVGSRTFPPYFFMTHYPVVVPDIAHQLEDFANRLSGTRWFAYMHFMDAHDCRAFNRPLRVMARWRFFPKHLIARTRGWTNRRFTYDSSLMALDATIGRFFEALDRTGQLANTVILATGDHASYYAENPRGSKLPLHVRTHYEDIEVPLLVYGSGRPPPGDGMIDSMGVTATLLDILGVEPDPSFKGVSAFAGGRDAVISESCGSGNADLERRDIHFTVTTKKYRFMATIRGSRLFPTELYDIENDPKELTNLVAHPGMREVVRDMYGLLSRERAEILNLRAVRITEEAAIAIPV
jgi:arylsulfatase A-like enzyme